MKKIEILAPAGSFDSVIAAVRSGADAVYLGEKAFSARSSAKNFDDEELKKATAYCHIHGVKVYVTINTIVFDDELEKLKKAIISAAEADVDALIVQNMGVARLAHMLVPDLALHASTQMSIHTASGVKALYEMGFKRVVLAREMSKKEIEKCCEIPVELEVFVHGAICMCYSGQCLMSSILGGRSGNRGRCAQPCRLPYDLLENGKTVKSGYVLSPKDMALVNDLGTLKRIGVTSLKIEGRLKRAEYVSAVVGVYRKYLDKDGNVSKKDMQELLDAFSRTGFTDGYFKGNLGKNMMSHDTPSNSAENKFTDEAKKRAAEDANIRKINTGIMGTLNIDAPLELTMYDNDGHYAYAQGTLKSEKALHKPMDEKRLRDQLSKLGSTPFECDDINITIDDGITIPIKEINSVRRECCESLINQRQMREKGRELDFEIEHSNRKNTNIILTCEVSDEEQFKAAVKNNIKRIYAPNDLVGRLKDVPDDVEIISKSADIFCEENIKTDGVLVSSPAAIYKYKDKDKEIYGNFRLNVFNSQTAQHYGNLKTVTLSPELNLHEIADLCENTNANLEVIGYGHIPLMMMKNCPIKAMGKCQKGKMIYKLKDRKREEFPIVCSKGCIAKLLNSKPIFMADKIADLKKLKINSIRLIFTVEKFAQCDKIIDMYKRALNGEKNVQSMTENTYTRGHFYRGVL